LSLVDQLGYILKQPDDLKNKILNYKLGGCLPKTIRIRKENMVDG
jgi:hypothetical protein